MIKKILLNNQEFTFTENDLPILINGAHGAGSSLFTVTLVTQLYKQGLKILFFSGYQMAKDEFKTQVEEIDTNKAEIIQKGDEENFLKTVEQIKDIDKRMFLVKNVELLGKKSFEKFKSKKKLIVSGDIEKCSFKHSLLNIPFKTVVLFSQLGEYDRVTPYLQKYEGYMWGNQQGVTKVEVHA